MHNYTGGIFVGGGSLWPGGSHGLLQYSNSIRKCHQFTSTVSGRLSTAKVPQEKHAEAIAYDPVVFGFGFYHLSSTQRAPPPSRNAPVERNRRQHEADLSPWNTYHDLTCWSVRSSVVRLTTGRRWAWGLAVSTTLAVVGVEVKISAGRNNVSYSLFLQGVSSRIHKLNPHTPPTRHSQSLPITRAAANLRTLRCMFEEICSR